MVKLRLIKKNVALSRWSRGIDSSSPNFAKLAFRPAGHAPRRIA
jgi:hypothetical protein